MTEPTDYGTSEHKRRASAWFAELRDDLCRALEAVEDDGVGPTPTSANGLGRFEQTAWQRPGGGGGVRGGVEAEILPGGIQAQEELLGFSKLCTHWPLSVSSEAWELLKAASQACLTAEPAD